MRGLKTKIEKLERKIKPENKIHIFFRDARGTYTYEANEKKYKEPESNFDVVFDSAFGGV